MEKTIVDKMVDRFLMWKLPKTFTPDCGIRFTPPQPSTGEEPFDKPGFWPVGTNLLDVNEARQMIEHLLAGVQIPASSHSPKECSEAFEWLRQEATRDGAPPQAGIVLEEWHAVAMLLTPNVK